jgi:hypothetical protein
MTFLNQTQRRTTVGRTPLNEWSASLYLTHFFPSLHLPSIHVIIITTTTTTTTTFIIIFFLFLFLFFFFFFFLFFFLSPPPQALRFVVGFGFQCDLPPFSTVSRHCRPFFIPTVIKSSHPRPSEFQSFSQSEASFVHSALKFLC